MIWLCSLVGFLCVGVCGSVGQDQDQPTVQSSAVDMLVNRAEELTELKCLLQTCLTMQDCTCSWDACCSI